MRDCQATNEPIYNSSLVLQYTLTGSATDMILSRSASRPRAGGYLELLSDLAPAAAGARSLYILEESRFRERQGAGR